MEPVKKTVYFEVDIPTVKVTIPKDSFPGVEEDFVHTRVLDEAQISQFSFDCLKGQINYLSEMFRFFQSEEKVPRIYLNLDGIDGVRMTQPLKDVIFEAFFRHPSRVLVRLNEYNPKWARNELVFFQSMRFGPPILQIKTKTLKMVGGGKTNAFPEEYFTSEGKWTNDQYRYLATEAQAAAGAWII